MGRIKQNLSMRALLLLGALTVLLVSACASEEQLPRLPKDAVILAFGDSLTRGYGARQAESYPTVLAALTGRSVINAGVSGEESSQGLMRLPMLLETHRPQLLILCHGGNDILHNRDLNRLAANLREMIAAAQAKGIAVVMLGVPKPGLFLSSAGVYREVAKSTGVVFIENLIPRVLSDQSLKSDAVHPNGAGYREIAERITATLQERGAI
jgi:acyl-CoA thioesterase-1